MTLSAKGPLELVVFQGEKNSILLYDRGNVQLINRVVIFVEIIISKNYCILPVLKLLFMERTSLITF